MKLNTRGRYAVMALADMASFSTQNPVSLRDISLRQNISLVYLEQIFSKLKKNNIVKSIRGTNGGYVLSNDPNQIKLSSIFLAVDEKVKQVQCKKESKKGCNGKSSKCITHYLWDELELYINDFFNKKKVNKLIKGYNSVKKIKLNEKNNLNILCRGAALRYLLTRLYDYTNTPKTALIKIKDPNEYYQKLITHNNLNTFKDYLI